MEIYTVAYLRHNKSTGGLAYKSELATSDRDEAKEKYYKLQGEYFRNPTFDFVEVYIIDGYGNVVLHDTWDEKKEAVAE